MKNLLTKYHAMSNRDDVPVTGPHIHALRIRAFAIEGINFTEKENAHFDVCGVCRFAVLDALRNLAPLVVQIAMRKAA